MLLALLTPAEANDRAKELFFSGAELYNQGRYESAITAWSEAYSLDPRPNLLFNLANAYERTGAFDEALDALTRYRPFAKPEETDALDSRIRSMQDRVAELKAAEAEEEAKRVASEKALEEERKRAAELERQQALAAQKSKVPVFPLVVTAAGVGLMAFGGVEGLAAMDARKTLKDPAVCTAAGLCKASAENAFATQKRASLLADVGLFTGAALTATGTALLIRSLAKKPASDTHITPWVSLDGTLGVDGAF